MWPQNQLIGDAPFTTITTLYLNQLHQYTFHFLLRVWFTVYSHYVWLHPTAITTIQGLPPHLWYSSDTNAAQGNHNWKHSLMRKVKIFLDDLTGLRSLLNFVTMESTLDKKVLIRPVSISFHERFPGIFDFQPSTKLVSSVQNSWGCCGCEGMAQGTEI